MSRLRFPGPRAGAASLSSSSCREWQPEEREYVVGEDPVDQVEVHEAKRQIYAPLTVAQSSEQLGTGRRASVPAKSGGSPGMHSADYPCGRASKGGTGSVEGVVTRRRWSFFGMLTGPKSWTSGKIKDGLKLAVFKQRNVYIEGDHPTESMVDEPVPMWIMECKSEKVPYGPLLFDCEWRQGDDLKGIWDPKTHSLMYRESDGSMCSTRLIALRREGRKVIMTDPDQR